MPAGKGTAPARPLVVTVLAVLLALFVPVAAAAAAESSAIVPVGALGPDGLPLADDLDAPVVAASAPTTGLRTLSAVPVVPIIFPMEKKWPWTDTWGAPRSGGRTHEGNDILVPKMTKAVAVVDGTVDWLNLDGKLSTYNDLPYYNLLLRGDDGNDYFYIHLNNDTPGTDDGKGGIANAYAPGLTNGTRVKAGQFIAYIGDSGNAEDTASHLHFELHLGGYKNPVNPYASLVAAPTYTDWTANGSRPLSGMGLPFIDVSMADWFVEDLALLYKQGVVRGGSDLKFRPYEIVSRAHFAAFLVRAFKLEDLKEPVPAESPFVDVATDFWGYPEITTAARLGLVKGVGADSFAPDASVTRAQMAAMLSRTLGLVTVSQEGTEVRPFPDVPGDYWAAREIDACTSLGLLKGTTDGGYHPEDTAKRAQAIAVMGRALRLESSGS